MEAIMLRPQRNILQVCWCCLCQHYKHWNGNIICESFITGCTEIFWKHPAQQMTIISSNWRHSRCCIKYTFSLISKQKWGQTGTESNGWNPFKSSHDNICIYMIYVYVETSHIQQRTYVYHVTRIVLLIFITTPKRRCRLNNGNAQQIHRANNREHGIHLLLNPSVDH